MVAYTDMDENVKAEVMEIATNACEKYLNDNQSAAQMIKAQYKPPNSRAPKHFINQMPNSFTFKSNLRGWRLQESLDRRFGTTWHVVVGEGFGFDISYEISRIFYMFFAGNLGVCAWKCSSY